jgi:hypothetical protein
MVCTPAWLQDRIQRDGPQIGRHYLIVYPMDLKLAVRFLKRRFEECHADTWVGLGEKLGRLGQWEFEDYAD